MLINISDNQQSIIFIPCDVSNWASVEQAFRTTREVFGPPDVVVNGAGIYEPVSLYKPPDYSYSSLLFRIGQAFGRTLRHRVTKL